MIIPYKEKQPQIGANVFIAPTAVVIGDVHIQDNVSIWFNAVIRADNDAIYIGENSNIQDNATVHVDANDPVQIGSNVTVGHNAVIHGCTLEDGALVGIGAVILNKAVIGKGAVISAGAVVMRAQQVAAYHLATGVPAKVKKALDPQLWSHYNASAAHYLHLKEEYKTVTDPDVN